MIVITLIYLYIGILCCGIITILQLFAIVYPGDGRPNGTEDRPIIILLNASNALNASTKDKEFPDLCSTPSCAHAGKKKKQNYKIIFISIIFMF